MNKEKYEHFLKEMESIVDLGKGDPEAAHCYADRLLIEFIKDLGYKEFADEWEKVEKYYA